MNLLRNLKIAGFALAVFTAPLAAQSDDLDSVLDQPVPRFQCEGGQTLRRVLEGIGRSYMVPIVIQDGVDGDVDLNSTNTDVRGLLSQLCRSKGFFWEIADGYIWVRKTKTVLYVVDYPQNTRSSQDSSSVTLGGAGGGGAGAGGAGGASGGIVPGGGAGGSGTGNGNVSDSTQVSVSGENHVEFWERLETGLGKRVGKDETVILDKFSGLVEVTGNLDCHARISTFLAKMNRRIGRQIALEAKILEVVLNDSSKLGIDWDVAAFSVGNGYHAVNVGDTFTKPNGSTVNGTVGQTIEGISSLAGAALPAATFTGTIGMGKVTALVSALKQQGNVRSTSAPRISALNNQTAFIKVADERTFYTQSNTTQVYGSSGNLGSSNPVVVNNYTPRSFSIGTFMRVVAQATDDVKPEDAIITLDVSPVLTRLQGEDRSPDGMSNAPILSVQQASTMVRVKHGESAVIGGFQTWSSSDGQRAIPGLGSLPVLGRMFRTDAKSEKLTELVIVITASVVDPGQSKPVDIDEVLNQKLSGHNKRNATVATPAVVVPPAPVPTKVGAQAVSVPAE